jgi:hypothetical protein
MMIVATLLKDGPKRSLLEEFKPVLYVPFAASKRLIHPRMKTKVELVSAALLRTPTG